MTDFQGQNANNGSADFDDAALLQGLPDAPGAAARVTVAPGPGNVITLPADAVIDRVEADGRDLVITLADGRTIVVPDGAIVLPQLVVGETAVPAANLAALLLGNEPEPAAGAPQSSGGNFATDPGDIQAAFDIGDLLPYTELSRPIVEEQEIIPFIDEEPEIDIEVDDSGVRVINAEDAVDEAGLPARGQEPQGTEASTDAEKTYGFINFDSPDGVGSISINGVAITAVGQTFSTNLGQLIITSIEPGRIGYDYILQDNTLSASADFFEVVIADADGDSATATLRIAIVDDGPIGVDDAATVPAASHDPITGNVLANDISGADNFPVNAGVTGFSNAGGSALPGATLQGTYGVLTLNANGSYSYTRDDNTPGGRSESFDYKIVDQDGTVSDATLVITIADSPTDITFVPVIGEGTVVAEGGLPPRNQEPVGTGEGADGDPADNSDPSETTGSTITFTSPDGVQSVTINGVAITPGALPQTIVQNGTGTFVVTGYTYDPVSDAGSITYVYTLADNTSGDNTSVTFDLAVTDLDGDTHQDQLVIHITDDVPTANADSDSVTEDGPLVADGNVITPANVTDANGTDGVADVPGADGASVTGVAAGNVAGPVTGSVATEVDGKYGTLTIAANGTYTYTLDNTNALVQGLDADDVLTDEVFTYTLTDGDGDTTTTTLSITVNGNDDPVVINGLDVEGGEQVVREDDLLDGSSPSAGALTQDGTFTLDSQDGLATLKIGTTTIFGDGVTYPVSITGEYGLLRITGVTPVYDGAGDVVSATIVYEYVLSDNTLDHSAAGQDSLFDNFTVTATDTDGSTDNASLDIKVIDDVPTANADSDSVTEDGPLVADGNVITAANVTDANDTDGVADVRGADGASVTGVAAGNVAGPVTGSVATEVDGKYGTLTIAANGTYTYTLDNKNALVQGLDADDVLTDEVFTYTLTDGDGDKTTTTLSITVNGNDDPVVINGLDVEGGEEVVDEENLSDGSSPSDPALTQDGTFTLDSQDGLATLKIGTTTIFGDGVTYPVSITGEYGLLRITGVTPVYDAAGDVVSATITYEYVLSENTLDHSAAGQDSLFDNFTVTATDTDGSTDNASLDIKVIDDVPTATDNENAVTEGSLVEGNLLTDNDGDDVDVDGADGYAPAGAVVAITSTNEATSQTVATVDGKLVLAGEFGTLTVNVLTGAYSYQSNANSTNIDAQDVFTYTIRDADGDEDTATLTIDIDNVAGQVSDLDVDVDEAGLSFGSDPLATSEVDANGQITVTNAVGPFTFTLTGANSDGDGTYGTLVLDENTGEYTYTLDTEFNHTAGGGRNVASGAESFTYDVHDLNGNLIGSGTINVNITDDIPSVDIGFSEEAPDTLTTQDADTILGASDTATGYVDKAFQIVSQEYGADGPGSLDVSYAMTLLAAAGTDTGLNSNGVDIRIYQLANGTVVGSTALSAPTLLTDPSVIFSISVDDTSGLVTLTQYAEIDHPTPGATAAPYDTQLIDLPSELVGVTATADIVDFDSDTAKDAETIDLNGFIKFADDGPSIDAAVTDADTVVLTTQDADTRGTDTDTDVSIANFSGAFTVASSSYGADGAGSTTWAYSFQIENAASGLSSDGDPITLFLIGTKVVGSTATLVGDVNASNTIFDLSVVANTGVVTLTQYAELDHADNNDTSAPYDDQLLALANDKVNLIGRATIQDGDGDTAFEQVSLDLGGNVKFADDGPALTEVALGSSVDVDETDGLPQSDTSDDPIISYVADFGADGQGSTSFAISIVGNGSTSLFTALGQAITLVQDGATSIKGVYSGTQTAFVVTINADGTVTLTQNVALEHNVDGANPVTDHNDTLNLAGLITATVTITDGDFDETSAPIGIGSALVFYDDGPSVTLSAVANDLTVSDANYSGDDTEDFSDAFTFDGGEDGEASTSYALSVTDGTYSGLVDTATGEQVFLFLEGGAVVGRNGTDAADADANGAEVFRVTVDANGTVELDQSRAVNHTINGGNGTSVTLASDSLIQLVATITDNDGDTASTPLNIGQNLSFTDDVPTAETTLTAYLDDDTLGGNSGGLNDQTPDTANLSGSLVDDVEGFGNDGGTVAFALTGAPSADFRYVSDGASGVNIQQEQGTGNWVTVVHVTLVPSTGAYTVSQTANIWHTDDNANDENNQNFTLNATLTDGDGDTAPVSLNIVVDDDTPRANVATSTGTVDEDGLSGGIANNGTNDVTGAATTAGGFVTGLFTAGADAPLTYGLDASSTAVLDALNLSSGGDALTYSIVGNTITATTDVGNVEVFTFTLNATSGAWEFTLKAPLDHADTNDSENVTDIAIQFASFITATDEDGDSVDAAATASVLVTVDDDTPRANADTDSVSEGSTVTGNVLTGDEGGADGLESPAIVGIASTNQGTSDLTITAGAFQLAGAFGTLTLNQNGNYSYTVAGDTIEVGGDDVFTYTIVDNDGDEVTTTLTFTVSPVNLSGNSPSVTVYEKALDTTETGADVDAGTVTGSDPTQITETTTGTVVVAGATSFGIAGGTSSGGITRLEGTYGTIEINEATGAFTYTLTKPVTTTPSDDDGITTEFGETFTYTAADGNGNSTTGSITINVVDDVPSVVKNGSAVPSVVLDESPIGMDEGGDSNPAGRDTVTVDFSGNFTASYGADGAAAAPSVTYALALNTSGGPVGSGLFAIDATDATAGDGDGIGKGGEIMLSVDGDDVVGKIGATEYFRISVDATGKVTFSQTNNVWHASTLSDDDTASLITAATNLLTLVATVTDGDGDTATASIDIGQGSLQIEDDGPTAIDPAAINGTLFNKIGSSATASLDVVDSLVGDNFGTDGPGTITFANITSGVTNSGLTHDGQPILLYLTNGGTAVEGRATIGGVQQLVFTVTLDQANSEYDIVMTRTVDDGSGAFFNNLSGGVAGNPPFKLIDSATTGADIEIVFTARSGGAGNLNGTINSDTDDLAVDSQFMDLNKGVSIDFGQFDYINLGGSTSDDRWDRTAEGDVNGFRFTIDQISNGTTVDVELNAYEYAISSDGVTPKVIPTETDYTQQDITEVDIYNATGVFQFKLTVERTGATTFTLRVLDSDGEQQASSTSGSLTFSGLTIAANSDGGLVIQNLLSDWKVETYTDSGYDRLTIDNVGVAATTDGKFSISELQIAQTAAGDPKNLTFDLQITDADGDSQIITDALDITIQPAALEPVVPPVVLDLDGGGNTYTPLSAGIAYDYDGDGVKTNTAWVAVGSAILALDANADGFVNDASEFVFGNGDMTDLEAIAAKYDGNGDGVLDANDAAYGSFGLWIDADLDAVSDAGEFVSLGDAGITAIELVSDGNLTIEAEGDVVVYGTASYTTADGSTGEVSDAGFMTGGEIDLAMMDALLINSALNSVTDSQTVPGDAELAGLLKSVLSEAAIDSLIDGFLDMQPAPVDIPVRTETSAFAGLLDSSLESGATHAISVPQMDISDESSMALAVNS